MARGDVTQARSAPHRVFTLNQAAQIIGVEERAVSTRAKRRATNGMPVAWPQDTPGNPLPLVLVDAEWVMGYAGEHDGPQADVQPITMMLPVLANGPRPMASDDPADGVMTEEISRRRELERQLEAERQTVATIERVHLEQEIERLRGENAQLRSEVEQWREAAAASAAAVVKAAAPRPAKSSG